MRVALLVLSICLAALPARSQPLAPPPGAVYHSDRLATVEVEIHPDTLAWILDPANARSDREWRARFTWDDGSTRETVEEIGFRLRGATSRDYPKKSFKVSFNRFASGRTWNAVEKLNLNGVYLDPSIVRSALAASVYREARVPDLRNGFVRLRINGTEFGVYANVEHVDEHYLAAHFRNPGGVLYKCDLGASLTYIGDDASAYPSYQPRGRIAYELKQGAGDFTDLQALTYAIDESSDADFPAALEAAFDVNGFLRALAVDVVTGNWDGYAYNQNNYYLYRDPEIGVFRYIPYDLDLTFGFDAPGPDWGTKPVTSWTDRSDASRVPRPLATRVLAVDDYRDRFAFYLLRLLDGPFQPSTLDPRIDGMRAAIRDAVEAARADPDLPFAPPYTFDEFEASFTSPLASAPVGRIEYGLKPFVETRGTTARAQIEPVDVPPILSELRTVPLAPRPGDPVTVRVWVEDEAQPAAVDLLVGLEGAAPTTVAMTLEQDGVYAATIGPFQDGTRVAYAVEARDAGGQMREAPRGGLAAPRAFTVRENDPTGLVVNEILASNDTTLADEAGEFDDWIELYNGSASPISLDGLFLTDGFDEPNKFALPDTLVPPGGHLIVWADDDPEQGPLHASFKLSADGEDVGVFMEDGAGGYVLVDGFSFGAQADDVSYGRETDGADTFTTFQIPTPGVSNEAGVETEAPLATGRIEVSSAFPNPAPGAFALDVRLPAAATVSLEVLDSLGRQVGSLAPASLPVGDHRLAWRGRLAAGLYVVVVQAEDAQGRVVRTPRRLTIVP